MKREKMTKIEDIEIKVMKWWENYKKQEIRDMPLEEIKLKKIFKNGNKKI